MPIGKYPLKNLAPTSTPVVLDNRIFMLFIDDEGNNVIPKAFFKHDKPSDTSVSVLERVDRFEFGVKL